MLKKIVSVLLILMMCFSLVACGQDKTLCRQVEGERVCKTFRQWGIADSSILKSSDVEYGVIVGNVIWGIVLIETIVAPVIIFGWYLYEPVDWKSDVYFKDSSSRRQEKIKG